MRVYNPNNLNNPHVVYRKLGASKTLSVLIEGESLVNDGTAIVMFLVLSDVVVHELELGPADIIWR